jgi:hypothetical protein
MCKRPNRRRQSNRQPVGELQWFEDGIHDVMGYAGQAVYELFRCAAALFKALFKSV